ncbi:hypothetical protein CYMTET_38604 [Cymbomonas tetramitiformis]|uniref:Uncharacterized protein n=1 Tax=Cymbomonas tetramitiformis TaxID=36881 RepID=A0AAE0CBL6_9CHLO|nr:hypothetical protein CYMTET_38604 [Cymbomonas tetramitiformis]
MKTLCSSMNTVMLMKCECAGYVLGNITTGLMDELCVINKGPTFEETDRLGVVPVDLTLNRRFYSQASRSEKSQIVPFHSHPLVIKEVLGRHAPPSYEDGACFLSMLRASNYHMIFGYSGIYVIEKLRGDDWTDRLSRPTIHKFLTDVYGAAVVSDNFVDNRTTEILALHSGSGASVTTRELRFIRQMSFDTLEDIQEYLLAYMHMFRMRLAVEYYPYIFQN